MKPNSRIVNIANIIIFARANRLKKLDTYIRVVILPLLIVIEFTYPGNGGILQLQNLCRFDEREIDPAIRLISISIRRVLFICIRIV